MGPSPEDRLRELAHAHLSDVAAYLRRRAYPLSAAEIDDLVEEVLVVVWRRLDDVPEGYELPWMIGVARNLLNNARRKISRRRRAHDRLTPGGDAASAEDEVIANEQLRLALASLSESERELLLLHYWEGLDGGALAVALEISPGAAATRLSRATARLRDAYRDVARSDESPAPEPTSERRKEAR